MFELKDVRAIHHGAPSVRLQLLVVLSAAHATHQVPVHAQSTQPSALPQYCPGLAKGGFHGQVVQCEP